MSISVVLLLVGLPLCAMLFITGQWVLFYLALGACAINVIEVVLHLLDLIRSADHVIDQMEKEPDPLADYSYNDYLKDIGTQMFPVTDIRNKHV